MDLASELQRIYDSEINAEITWFWDGGFTVRLGDKDELLPGRGRRELGGRHFTLAPGGHCSLLSRFGLRAIARAGSEGARGEPRLPPPRTGLQVRCPHCGSPNANAGLFDELLAFTCNHCGCFVEVKAPKAN
jgi:hypothetical protein